MFTCKVGGIQRVSKELELAPSKVAKAALEGMMEHAAYVMAQSKAQVPRSTGTLAESGYVGIPISTRYTVTVPMGYGGPNDIINPISGESASEYAIPVHEQVEIRHENGKAKFLEDPLNESAANLLEAVGRRIRALL
jgi:hypothetical protein